MNKVNLPVHVAFGCCSKEVVELMVQYGADILNLSDGQNILHSAVITGFNKPQIEEDICKMVKWLIDDFLPPENVPTLLFQENPDGFYPLELAAQQGCLRIMKILLERKGHVASEMCRGLGIYRLHDITEYEIGDRHRQSPINMLAYLDVKKLQDPETSKIILSPLFLDWIDQKIKCNIPLLLLWFFMRFLFVSIFIILDLDVHWIEAISGNKTIGEMICPDLAFVNLQPHQNSTLSLVLVFSSFAIFAVYIVQAVENRRRKLYLKGMDLNGAKTTIASIKFFRAEQAILVVAILSTTIESLELLFSGIQEYTAISFLITDIARSGIPVFCLWSVCYFIQLVPSIGPSIISIQSMLVDMARFMLLYVIIVFPFIHVFESFALINSKEGCVEEFKNPLQTAYTLFRMMLNIYDPSTGSIGENYENVAILYVLHVLFIFMVGVLLLNFLIAMMSKKAAEVADDEMVILKLNQLAIVVCLEERIFCIPVISKWLYRHLRKLAFKCDGGKVYLKSVTSRFLHLYEQKKD